MSEELGGRGIRTIFSAGEKINVGAVSGRIFAHVVTIVGGTLEVAHIAVEKSLRGFKDSSPLKEPQLATSLPAFQVFK
jgi:hypothetical protein